MVFFIKKIIIRFGLWSVSDFFACQFKIWILFSGTKVQETKGGRLKRNADEMISPVWRDRLDSFTPNGRANGPPPTVYPSANYKPLTTM